MWAKRGAEPTQYVPEDAMTNMTKTLESKTSERHGKISRTVGVWRVDYTGVVPAINVSAEMRARLSEAEIAELTAPMNVTYMVQHTTASEWGSPFEAENAYVRSVDHPLWDRVRKCFDSNGRMPGYLYKAIYEADRNLYWNQGLALLKRARLLPS